MSGKQEKICGIYKLENQVNGKVYIGQSVNIMRRLYTHRCLAYKENNPKTYNLYLYVAIRKYGKNAFTHEIIERCKKSDLNEREKYWINYYKSNEKEYGYNLCDGGNNGTYPIVAKENSNITIKKKHIAEIKDLLLNSQLSINEIAQRYNMTDASITNINRGHSWYCADTHYPIRDTRKKTLYFCSQCGAQVSTKHSKLCRKCDSERQSREKGNFVDPKTLNNDLDNYGIAELAKKYKVSEKTICRWVKKYNLKFRGWKQKRRLKYEQIQHSEQQ